MNLRILQVTPPIEPAVAYLTLRFDAALERAVVDLWLALAHEGIELTGLTGHRPHITVAAYAVNDDVLPYVHAMETFAAATPRLPIHLHALGVFPQNGVVYLAPVVADPLLALHRKIHGHFGAIGRVPIHHETLQPGAWVPHCTIVSGADRGTVAQVVTFCSGTWQPLEGWIEGMGMLVPPQTKDAVGVTFAPPTGRE